MANTFTLVGSRPQWPPNAGPVRLQGLLVVDTGAGAAASPIPASLFGLTYFRRGVAIKSDNAAIIQLEGVYSADGLSTTVLAKATATFASANIANGTYFCDVEGTP